MMSCDNKKTFLDSLPLCDINSLLMDVNNRLWMNCSLRRLETASKLLEVLSTWINDQLWSRSPFRVGNQAYGQETNRACT